MTQLLRRIIGLAILASLLMVTKPAEAAVKFSLSGSRSESNAGYQKIESGAGSIGLSMDLGEYFMVGYSHRQELSSTVGYQQKAATSTFVYFQTLSHVTSNAIDLTLILYGGEVVTPFIFAGLAVKHYIVDTKEADGTVEHLDMPHPGPQGGAGLSIRLNQKFALKLTYTMTDGIKQLPGENAEMSIDTYTQMGITYSL